MRSPRVHLAVALVSTVFLLSGCGTGPAENNASGTALPRSAGAMSAEGVPLLAPGQSLGEALEISAVPNLRDLGGYQTADGATVLFLSVADGAGAPGVFHCTTGKDRTGWAAAALLTLLGVPKETVMEDFLRSNDYILLEYQAVLDEFVAGGGDRETPLAIFGVKAEYLEASFDEMRKQHGTIEDYFSDGLGIDAAGQDALRDRLLE